jgi:hypothetical protein
MSPSIDKRIVEMEFLNKNFEERIKESKNSLKDFDEALKEAGKAGALTALGAVAKGVGSQFSALGTIATGALLKIGAQALELGQKLAKSLTIDQVFEGFKEYELKMNSIKIMLANAIDEAGVPVTLDHINRKLAELNAYADRTIYSFSDMTRNISDFTNQGIHLDLAVASIQGVANVAAISGANTDQAASAMNAFAKSLSGGFVQLRQWRSIELAKMGTLEFKKQLIDSAVAAGTLTERLDGLYDVVGAKEGKVGSVISATKEFNYSLFNQWLTTDVLVDTLSRYSDETTEIGARASEAATKVRTFSQLMDTLKEAIGSGWGVTFERIIGNFNQASDLFTGISEELGKMVKESSDRRNEILTDWGRLGGRDALIEGLTAAWYAFKTVLLIVKVAWKEVFGTLKRYDLTRMTKNLRDFLIGLRPSSEQIVKLKTIFLGLFNALYLGWKIVSAVFKGIADGLKKIGENTDTLGFLADVFSIFTKLREAADKGKLFADISKAVSDGIGWIADQIGRLVQNIQNGNALEKLTEFLESIGINTASFGWVKDLTSSIGEFFTSIGTWFSKGGLSGVFSGIGVWLKAAFAPINNFFGGIDLEATFENLKGGLASLVTFLKNTFGPVWELLKYFGQNIGEFAVGVKEDGISVWDAIKGFFTKIGEVFSGFKDTFSGEKELSFEGFFDFLKGLVAGGILLKVIQLFDKFIDVFRSGKSIKDSFLGILGKLKGTLEEYQNSLKAKTLVGIATAVAILVGAVLILSFLDPEKVSSAVAAITLLLANLTGVMLAMKKGGNPAKAAASMLLLGLAVIMMAGAVRLLEGVDPGAMFALAAMMAGLVASARIMGKGKDSKAGAMSLLGLAVAVRMVVGVVKELGDMNPDQLNQGLWALAKLIGMFTAFSAIIGKFGGKEGSSKSILAGAAGMLLIAFAVKLFIGSIETLGNMDPMVLLQGFIAVMGILSLLVIAMENMKNPNVLLGAAAMAVIALALNLFIPIFEKFGNMKWEDIGKGLLAIAGVLAVFVAASYLVQPILPVLVAFGLTLAAMAVGIAAIAFGIGFAIGSLAQLLLVLAKYPEIVDQIPEIFEKIGEGIVRFAEVIAEGAPEIAGAFTALLLAGLEAWAEMYPTLLETIWTLVTDVLLLMKELVPDFIKAGAEFLVALLQGIGENIGAIVEEIYNIVIAILNAITEKLPDLITAGGDLIIAFLEGIGAEELRIIEAAFKVVVDFINGLADAVEENMPLIFEACENLASAFLTSIAEYLNLEEGESIGGHLIDGLIAGINAGVTWVVDAVRALGRSVLDALTGIFKEESPSKETTWMGENLDKGLINGIVALAGKVVKAAQNVGEQAMDGLRSTMSGLSDVLDSDINLNPVITPVLDLNQVQAGANTLSNLLSNGQSYDLAASQISADRLVAEERQNGSNAAVVNGGQGITNQFNLNGITIRSEADIEKIAELLYRKQENAMRARGIKPAYSF